MRRKGLLEPRGRGMRGASYGKEGAGRDRPPPTGRPTHAGGVVRESAKRAWLEAEAGTAGDDRGVGLGLQAVFVTVFVAFRAGVFAVAAFFRPSTVWAPNFFVKRSTRPSVSISF